MNLVFQDCFKHWRHIGNQAIDKKAFHIDKNSVFKVRKLLKPLKKVKSKILTIDFIL